MDERGRDIGSSAGMSVRGPFGHVFEITIDFADLIRKYGFWKVFWNVDIFINSVPFLKTLVGVNVVVWLLMVFVFG